MDIIVMKIKQMVDDEPNNMMLGKLIRQFMSELDEMELVSQFNRNRHPDDWVDTYEEMQSRIKEMYDESGKQGGLQ